MTSSHPTPIPETHPALLGTRVEWRSLYEELGERVFRLLHRMTGDAALAEDLAHDTWVKVHESRSTYDGRGDIAAWVFRVAGNIGRDELRRRAMRARRLVLHTPDSNPSSEPEMRIALQRALDSLEPGYREVVLLHDVDGFSHAEIAEMLDIREGSSRARLSRAREILRGVLDADYTR